MAIAVLVAEFAGDQVVLSTAAQLVYTADHMASASEPQVVICQNNDASIDITIGASDVADGVNGVLLVANGNNSVSIPLRTPGTEIYAIAASGTPSLNFVRA